MGSLLEHRAVRRMLRPVIAALGGVVARCIELPLRYTSRRLGIAVMYHSVAVVQGDKEREIVAPHGIAVFESQLRHLRSHYRIVAADELLSATRSRRRGERFPVTITFDDDLGCHAELSLPALQRTGVTATFFLSGASLEGPFAFWWERLQRASDEGLGDLPALVGTPARPGDEIHALGRIVEAMTPTERDAVSTRLAERIGDDLPDAGIRADQVRALVSGGMSIGFHTLRHDPLTQLDDGALADALQAGRDELERVASYRLQTIGYPHGKADARVAAAARDAGFSTGYSVAGDAVHGDDDPLLLPRIAPTYKSLGHFAIQVALELLSRRA